MVETPYPQSKYLTCKEAAAYARVSVRTLQRHLKNGILRRHSFGHRVLIDRTELETLIRARDPRA